MGSYPNPSPKKSREYDSTEFYVQCAIKFVHDHENFRWKSLKGNGRGGIEEGKERGPPGYFVLGLPSSQSRHWLVFTVHKYRAHQKSNPLGKLLHLWNCSRFFHHIYSVYR